MLNSNNNNKQKEELLHIINDKLYKKEYVDGNKIDENMNYFHIKIYSRIPNIFPSPFIDSKIKIDDHSVMLFEKLKKSSNNEFSKYDDKETLSEYNTYSEWSLSLTNKVKEKDKKEKHEKYITFLNRYMPFF